MLWRLVKFVFVVAFLGAVGIAGYALVGDLTPPPSEHSISVTLDDG
ncbi:MAG: hypothetical protein ACU0CY_01445 [Maritimibacter harenae]|jgi:hypothetical protein|uniref:Uncharacterized protein n=1 Tax=Maritimibacter harenae TaxID=2606218 RepID=A0A845M4I9_9RHOB|nr:hypothetical protein [Maritimibacter harenae]MZR13318.1 hypothetical protein [Maritimibacter harenae]